MRSVLIWALAATIEELEGTAKRLEAMPRVVCLCGSTRFMDAFDKANREKTIAGEIVLSVEPTDASHQHDSVEANAALKARLDQLHLRKIDLADYVYVLNVGGYIGESTRREIAYAGSQRKPIYYLEGTPTR